MKIKMVRLLLVIALLFSFSPVVFADDEQEIRQLKEALWNQAYRTQDAGLLDSILHPSFQMIDANGNRSNKEKELKFVKNNQWNPPNFIYRIERLDIYKDEFAIVDGEGNTDTYSYKSSNVLIKEDGRWQAISSHVSGYKEK